MSSRRALPRLAACLAAALACAPSWSVDPLAPAPAAPEALVVVCAPGCPYPKMAPADVEAAWSGRRPRAELRGLALWDLPDGSETQASFALRALSKDSAQYRAMWARLVFTGTARPPKVASDEDALAKELLANPKAIGYMGAQRAERAGLKVLANY